jgi:hypothetical protein
MMPVTAMRVVLYDDETMEPLTVLHLPSWATTRLVSGERIRVPMILPIRWEDGTGEIGPVPKTFVHIWFEKFIRHGREHWFAFTAEGEDAVMCKAVFLPGQQREVQSLERTAFMQGLLSALER